MIHFILQMVDIGVIKNSKGKTEVPPGLKKAFFILETVAAVAGGVFVYMNLFHNEFQWLSALGPHHQEIVLGSSIGLLALNSLTLALRGGRFRMIEEAPKEAQPTKLEE